MFWEWNLENSVIPRERASIILEVFKLACMQPGDITDIGCYRGAFGVEFCRFVAYQNLAKHVHLFDTFAGLPPRGKEDSNIEMAENYDADLEEVMDRLDPYDQVSIYVGDLAIFNLDKPLCFAFIDVDLYKSTWEALWLVFPRIVPGGWIVIDDYGADLWWPGVKKAVDEWFIGDKWDVWPMPEKYLYVARRKP